MFTRKYLKQLKQLNSNFNIPDNVHRICKMSEFFFYIEKDWKSHILSLTKKYFLNLLKDFCIFLFSLIKCIFGIFVIFCAVIKIIYLKYIYIKLKRTDEFKKFNDRVKTAEIVDD